MPTIEKSFSSLPGRVYVKDRNGVYIFCNEELAKEFGFSSTREMLGKTDFDLRCVEQAEILRKVDFQVMATGNPVSIEESGTHLDNSSAVYIIHIRFLLPHLRQLEGILYVQQYFRWLLR